VRRSEWLVAGYFVYLALAVWLQGQRQHGGLMVAALALSAGAFGLARVPADPAWQTARDWAPGVFLLAGYWLPGKLFVRPDEALEQRLMRIDEIWLGPFATRSAQLPRLVSLVFEVAYLLCYPLVPAAFGLLYATAGTSAAVADAFWTPVLLAVFICYGLLPWLPTRPPRALLPEIPKNPASSIRRLNLAVLKRASIQVNTLPSGHVAAAAAAALAVGRFTPVAGVAIGLLALAIAAGAVIGRYHYAVDVVLGVLTAVLAFALTSAAGL
jgi:membrane-associated phospholipid phosphatase